MHYDTYFLNSKVAYETALKRNNVGDNEYLLQLCYYDGEKIDSDLPNLIHLPLENLLNSLAYGTYRVPQMLDFSDVDIPGHFIEEIKEHFAKIIFKVGQIRYEESQKNLYNLKTATLDFSEPLRFYLIANANTTVMQYICRNIANMLNKMGYDVHFHLDLGIDDTCLYKGIAEYNPHVTININHFNNTYLGDDVFNFIWFQDQIDHLIDTTTIIKNRERDFVLSLHIVIDKLLERRNISFQRQSFCANLDDYNINKNIKREKKIVFIGSSQVGHMKNESQNVQDALDYCIKIFSEGELFTEEKTKYISQKFNVPEDYISLVMVQYVIRDLSVLWLCSIKSDYKIEIYGSNWDKYDSVKPYYKGMLKYGKEVADVYSSATYAFSPSHAYSLMQRVYEASACGAIPIVYDVREIAKEPDYSDAFCYYRTYKDLESILINDQVPAKTFDRLLRENSYEAFIEKIVDTVKKNIK